MRPYYYPASAALAPHMAPEEIGEPYEREQRATMNDQQQSVDA